MVSRIKIVPDDSPNAEGIWVPLKPLEGWRKMLLDQLHHRERWDYYDAQARVHGDFHVVAVE